MFIKEKLTRLLFTLSLLLILPFVQKQWFNLYLFNSNEVTIYSILYYLSGSICPFLIGLYSLKNSIKILKKNRVLLDKLFDILLNQETIDKKVFKLTTSKLLKVWFNCFKLKKIFSW